MIKKIESSKYKFNLAEISRCLVPPRKGYISGKELVMLDSRYKPQQNYRLLDIIKDCKGSLYFRINSNDHQQHELLIPKEKVNIIVPYYR